jgi:RNA polymerase sigma factor (sigma-70 family)
MRLPVGSDRCDAAEANAEFVEFLSRVRSGDESAAADLVRRYEPEICRFVRFHLSDSALRRVLDSMDICQCVFARFFANIVAGRFDLQRPQQLLQLLLTMAKNEFRDQLRKQRTRRRGGDKPCGDTSHILREAADSSEPVYEQLAAIELVEAIMARLDEHERDLLNWKMREGLEWSNIAAICGGTAESARKRLARALDRVAAELRLVEKNHEISPTFSVDGGSGRFLGSSGD